MSRPRGRLTYRRRRALYRTRRWRVLRFQVFDRDGWRCQRCGRFGRLECHHADTDPKRFFDPAALLTLCRDCHIEHHREESAWREYEAEREAWHEFAGELSP